MKHSLRSLSTGRFVTEKSKKTRSAKCCGGGCGCETPTIVAGRLYEYRGIIVRAFGLVNNKRFVSFHKTLTGLVDDKELKTTTKAAVARYLLQV